MSNVLLFKSEIQDVIHACCKANRCAKLAKSIDVEWSGKLNKAADVRIATMTIVLSERVMSTLSAKAQAEVVSRETCALIAWHLEFNTRRHGLWETLMEKAGYPDARVRLRAFEKEVKIIVTEDKRQQLLEELKQYRKENAKL